MVSAKIWAVDSTTILLRSLSKRSGMVSVTTSSLSGEAAMRS
ncbi:MAG: hypothetical protein BWY79_00879 [Actinobacteria bacterium ADurb.Bin444]|nr:MAG: hypothetical protein BWY79_00879 [Actinobacteria bacterium ADurb.Bin444]